MVSRSTIKLNHYGLPFLLVLACAMTAGMATFPIAAKADDTAATKQPAATNPDEINERLTSKRIAMKLEAAPLADAIEFVGSSADVNTFVDWKALESLGIGPDAPVTLKLRNPITVAQALRLILRSVNPALSYDVEDEVVIITGSAESQQPQPLATPDLQMRVYDVKDFVVGGSSGDSLSQVITQSITPDAWKTDASGPRVTSLGATLVVNAPESTHDEINELLGKLRHPTANGIIPEAPAEPEKKDEK